MFEILRQRVDEAIIGTKDKLETRIDKFGVTQPNITLQEGKGRIIIELPGADDPDRIRDVIQRTAELEFWYTYKNEDGEVLNILDQVNTTLRGILEPDTTNQNTPTDSIWEYQFVGVDTVGTDSIGNYITEEIYDSVKVAGDASAENQFNPLFEIFSAAINEQQYLPGPVVGFARGVDTAKINSYFQLDQIKNILRNQNVLFYWDANPVETDDPQADLFYRLYAIKKTPGSDKSQLTGDHITDAFPQFDQTGQPAVGVSMDGKGAEIWSNMTLTAMQDEGYIAIVLDGRVYSAPRVPVQIKNGRTIIEGSFTLREAESLATILKAGKLDAPVYIVQEDVIGPTLGAESVRAGIMSLLIGLLLVLVFMVFYYAKGGVVSVIALFLNLVYIIAVLASLGSALTLPGIAGIVLTIGMAVDANVIIYERIREEIAKGKGIKLAVADGFKNSYSAIIDANLTTLITGIMLLLFGLGPVEGFAVVLVIGIFSSFFTAVLVGRLLFDVLYFNRKKEPSFATKISEGAFKNLNFNFIGIRKATYGISGAIVVIGLISILVRGFELGVDFKGGWNYTIALEQEANVEQITSTLAEEFGETPLVKTYGGPTRIQVTTAYKINDNDPDLATEITNKLLVGLVKDGYVSEKSLSNFEADNIQESMKVKTTIADDIRRSAIFVTIFASLGIFLYLLFRFRRWQFGVGALAAVLHDVLFILGVFSIFQGIFPWSMEVNQAFIAALLTVIGYSINDTVVIFDRVREFLNLHPTTDMETNTNNAINSTVSRTLITSLTTLFVVIILLIFGGESIRGFSFALFLGIIIGTYSSIFIATPITLDLLRKKEKK
jgi:SecD/SecF fusion protein